jgi:hypothetical protein
MTNPQNSDFLEFAHDTCPPERVATNTPNETATNENKVDTKKTVEERKEVEEVDKTERTCEKSRRDQLRPGC